jgi:hypothetical protein
MSKKARTPSKAEPYGPFSGLVTDATPPTRIVSLVTPGWVEADAPPPDEAAVVLELPELLLSDALLHAAATSASSANTAIHRAEARIN